MPAKLSPGQLCWSPRLYPQVMNRSVWAPSRVISFSRALPFFASEREKLALLLENHDVPPDVLQESCQPVVVGCVFEAPTRGCVLDREELRAAAVVDGKVVHHAREAVSEREAVTYEEDAKARARAPRERDVSAHERIEGTRCQPALHEADVDGNPEHDPDRGTREQSDEPLHQRSHRHEPERS